MIFGLIFILVYFIRVFFYWNGFMMCVDVREDGKMVVRYDICWVEG